MKRVPALFLIFVMMIGILSFNVFSAGEEDSSSDPYFQHLPESVTGCLNLYDALNPVKGYYTATKYDTGNKDVLSVVIPVEEGDRIAANSFGPISENKGTVNGIRVTYLLGGAIASSLSAGTVYKGYTADGYITVPDGVDAVCVPWWTPDAGNWLTLIQKSKNYAVHNYKSGFCTNCGEQKATSPYLQALPSSFFCCENLYPKLAPVSGYYTETEYKKQHLSVVSVVIPVEEGDRIAANSFGPATENMGSTNGIRVTYLSGDEIVTSLSASAVYNGYKADGYITVPDGVDAVCVPWWTPDAGNWLTLSQKSKNFSAHSPKTVSAEQPTCTKKGYTAGEICGICETVLKSRVPIPATGHSYTDSSCSVCGAVKVSSVLQGKYVSVLGDSISTFKGVSNNTQTNNTLGKNNPRYDVGEADTKPSSYCLLESVNDTWWMNFASRGGMNLLVNNSWAGSQVFGGQTSDGRVIPAAYLERCINLHDNTLSDNPNNEPIHPDVIFVYMGINDYNFNRSNVGDGEVEYAALSNPDGTYVTPKNFGEAYGILLHKMQTQYPNAQIFAMTLLPENLYTVDKTAWEKHNAYIRAAAAYYNVPLVDLAKDCAITWDNFSGYMIDRIHPTTAGMSLIADCIEDTLSIYYHTHTPIVDAAVAPTCTKTGLTVGSHCLTCGEILEAQEIVPVLDHFYEDGICADCGLFCLAFYGTSLSFQNDLAINYKVKANLLRDYSDIYVVAEVNGTPRTLAEYDNDGTYLSFRFLDIAPQTIGDTITATLYATKDGTFVSSEPFAYSVQAYCYRALELYESDVSLRALIVELLHYGAKAQLYADYKTDFLVDASLSTEQLAWGNQTAPELVNHFIYDYELVSDPRAIWKGAGLVLGNAVTLKLQFAADHAEDLTVQILLENGKQILLGSESFVYSDTDEVYCVYVDALNADQMSTKLYLTIVDDEGTPCSGTVQYSIESYAFEMQNSTNSALAELVKAMMNYGNAAKAYGLAIST